MPRQYIYNQSSSERSASSRSSSNMSFRESGAVRDEASKSATARSNGNVSKSSTRRCTVCGKSFNPLRRRYQCRSCSSVVCSNCSISRKVDAPYEGTITVRMCVSCKLDSMASDVIQNDDIEGSSNLGGSASISPTSSDRLTSHHSSSSSSVPNLTYESKVSSAIGSSQRSARKDSAASSSHSTTPSRRDSFGSSSAPNPAPGDCPLCMNEACAPVRDFFEIPYAIQQGKRKSPDRYISAAKLDNEEERMTSVAALQEAIKKDSKATNSFVRFASMAAIATSCGTCIVGILGADNYDIIGQHGLTNVESVAKERSIAAHVARSGVPLVCSDLSADIRFAGNPWRRDTLQACFYAGIPLTLKNGHVVGAIEVFDTSSKFACVDVISQLQSVVKGLQKKLEDLAASKPDASSSDKARSRPHTSASFSSNGKGGAKQAPNGPASRPTGPAPRAPAPTRPPNMQRTQSSASSSSMMSQSSQEMKKDENASTDAGMESQLMQLLSQTTNTQEQLKNQQGQMVSTITNHSKQIDDMAKQLERMESTMASKLDGLGRDEEEEAEPVSK